MRGGGGGGGGEGEVKSHSDTRARCREKERGEKEERIKSSTFCHFAGVRTDRVTRTKDYKQGSVLVPLWEYRSTFMSFVYSLIVCTVTDTYLS